MNQQERRWPSWGAGTSGVVCAKVLIQQGLDMVFEFAEWERCRRLQIKAA